MEVYPGGYEEFLWSRQKRSQEVPERAAEPAVSEALKTAMRGARPTPRRRLNPIKAERIRQRIRAIETEIESLEDASTKLQAELVSAGSNRSVRERVVKDLEASHRKMQGQEEEWEELSELLAAGAR